MRVPTNTSRRNGAAVTAARRASPQRRPARSITVVLTELDDGKVRVSAPGARGWAAVARGPFQVWGALRAAMIEVQVAGYAAWSGQRYDHDALTMRDDPTEPPQRRLSPVARHGVSYGRNAVVRPDQAHPSEWVPRPDGSWTSPKGRTYRDAGFIERLVEKRAGLGLPLTYDDWACRPEGRTA